jgi:hypothetical protein
MPLHHPEHSGEEKTIELRWSEVRVLDLVCWCSAQADEDSEHSIILDSSVRRFRCQKSYLRAHAALRWMNSRNAVLRGQKAHAGHLQALQATDNTLRVVCRPQKPFYIAHVDGSDATLSLLEPY